MPVPLPIDVDLPPPRVSIKVRCETLAWSYKLQLALLAVGIDWLNNGPFSSCGRPWNIDRPFLVIQPSVKGGWYISWATPTDFAECPFPEYSARDLVRAYRRATA